ncbi:LEAF RUST 10 DISEASE-RESISTANCE LOCUS RECEPTOR-LIKE PROTEIN KINASE-like 2.8 isoform X1 [Ziziphus jujuba]|uniref:non-specific serine/threonine protein kinase n=1 Tax=Ziziphus jujuba TaxID=326968 RepID=A0ABM4A819_ZIZJJ|nr:LEAF RUST 10 DISEASE-RESISTANCE LOCUS RECEPTOR-LIKE PROTEIN KINASE-like 2.8 isoform X1 [Ziziphus jujuba]
MDLHHLYQNLLIFMVAVILIHGPSSSSANEYDDCGNLFECGSIRVGYPFWGSNRPKQCGYPDFQLTCPAANVTLLSIFSEDYRVLKIDEDAGTMDAVRNEYRTDVCLDGQTQPKNTTIQQSGLFTYNSDTEELRLFYSCNSQLGAIWPNHFNCSSSINYYFTQAQIATQNAQGNLRTGPTVIESLLGSCAQNVLVPIFKTQATILQSANMTALPIADVITAVSTGFRSSWNATIRAQCDSCLTQSSTNRCGFSTTSNELTCYEALGGSPGSNNKLSVGEGIAVGAGGLAVIIIGLCICFFLQRRKKRTMVAKEEEEDYLDHVPGMPERFSFEDLKAMTQNFHNKLGEGGFGIVFEGTLSNGMKVAVKRLDGLRQIKKSFLAEVATIGSIHHVNLVRMIGFCVEKSHRLLVYQYMRNGSLDKWIFHKTYELLLSWQQRKKIILDIAKGLSYLHEDCRQKIIHLDIKPENILLDEDFNGKLSDFGLSKLIERDQSQVVTTMRGTPGYLAPEWLGSAITEKVDVYSFGIVIMEIVCGRRNVDRSQPEEAMHLLALFKQKCEENQLVGLIDKCCVDMRSHEVEVVNMMKVAAWCLQSDFVKRPSMSMVVKVLEGVMDIEHNMDYDFTEAQFGHREENRDDVATSLLPSVLSQPR